MTERGTLLDLPDEAPRQWRGVPAALVGAAVVLAAGVVVARTLALGGWVRPWLAVEAVLALPAMIAAWLLAGPHRFRTWITAAAMVVGLALQPLAAAGATPSPNRLAQMADAIGLPGETVRDVKVGNGRCRPNCSELRRTVVVRGISFAKVRAQVQGLLRVHDYEVKTYAHDVGRPLRIDAASDTVMVQLELRQVSLAETRVASVWIAKGPKSDFEVG